jgi:allantoate deiminase
VDASKIIEHCRTIATFTEEPGYTTRTFLSPPMRGVHAYLREWMERLNLEIRLDAAGNLRGTYCAAAKGPALWIGSHLDTVPRAGAFDGLLGVVLALAMIEELNGRPTTFPVEIVAFSEEEGVRFGVPFIGSRALIGDAGPEFLAARDANGISIADAIRAYGLDPNDVPQAALKAPARGYLEFHIEQGPALEGLGLPVGVVDAIVGLSRLRVSFEGQANHAGTTPMPLRRDALAGAAEWMCAVERDGLTVPGLVATVGWIEVEPGAANVIPGLARATLDVRHADDSVRQAALARLLDIAEEIANRRNLTFGHEVLLDQPACAMDAELVDSMERALVAAGQKPHRMPSGAGHDAMILARLMPAVMLFLRSPGGISHHPDENVLERDVAAALAAGMEFLRILEVGGPAA